MTLAAQRVALGAEWLDQHGPPVWWKLIDLDHFALSSPCKCVFGWVFGDGAETEVEGTSGYDIGLAVVKKVERTLRAGKWAELHGFDSDMNANILYGDLQTEWRRVIAERLAS